MSKKYIELDKDKIAEMRELLGILDRVIPKGGVIGSQDEGLWVDPVLVDFRKITVSVDTYTVTLSREYPEGSLGTREAATIECYGKKDGKNYRLSLHFRSFQEEIRDNETLLDYPGRDCEYNMWGKTFLPVEQYPWYYELLKRKDIVMSLNSLNAGANNLNTGNS